MAIVNNVFSTPTIGKSRPTDANIVGTVNTTPGGISVEEFGGQDIVRKTVITFTNTPITLFDTTPTAQGGSVLAYTFPEGVIEILGANGAPVLTTTSALASTLNASAVLTWGVGSVAQATGTLATTQIDICPGTGVTPGAAVASATVNVAGTCTPGYRSATSKCLLDGSTTPAKAFLNVAVPTATDIDADATATVSGTVTITWINHGDHV